VVTQVVGPPFASGNGSLRVRSIRIGRSAQGSSSASSSSNGSSGRFLPWLKPVVHLELEPGAGEDVHDRRRLELVTRQEDATDETWARVEQLG